MDVTKVYLLDAQLPQTQERYDLQPYPPAVFCAGQPSNHRERRYEMMINDKDIFVKVDYINDGISTCICKIPRGNGHNSKNIFLLDNESIIELISFYRVAENYDWTYTYLSTLIKIAWLYTQVNKVKINNTHGSYRVYMRSNNSFIDQQSGEKCDISCSTQKNENLISIPSCNIEDLNITKTIDDFAKIAHNFLFIQTGEKHLTPKSNVSTTHKTGISKSLCSNSSNFDIFKLLVRTLLGYVNV